MPVTSYTAVPKAQIFSQAYWLLLSCGQAAMVGTMTGLRPLVTVMVIWAVYWMLPPFWLMATMLAVKTTVPGAVSTVGQKSIGLPLPTVVPVLAPQVTNSMTWLELLSVTS